MNQHTFVKNCFAYYEEQGLIPGNPDDGDWEECHYPEPEGIGNKIILLLHNDHQQQGLYQSEEYHRPCFFNWHVKEFLDDTWCFNWFELYGIYDKWKGYYSKKARANIPKERMVARGKNVGKTHGKVNIAKIPREILVSNGKATGTANVAKTPRETLVANGRITGKIHGKVNAKTINGQRWKCLDTGYISTPAGLSSYQRARNIDTSLRVRVL